MEVFQRYGCRYKRKKGSHHILTHPNAKRAVVIPEYDEIDIDRKIVYKALQNNLDDIEELKKVFAQFL